jgi:hypothetical protein
MLFKELLTWLSANKRDGCSVEGDSFSGVKVSSLG